MSDDGLGARELTDLWSTPVAVVADVLDSLGLRAQALDPTIRPLYPTARLIGRAAPVLVEATDQPPDHPYDGEIRAVEALQPGDVTVIAADDACRAALWGELFSHAARARGAVGALTDGFVRDGLLIGEMQFPVFCRGCSPLDTLGRAQVREIGVEVVCGGVTVAPGDYLAADGDGGVVIPEAALGDVLETVRTELRGESGARADLLSGQSLREVWERHGVL